jgi:phospholipid/cholesterol/gamma-HCH transport system substrate-binding protein
MSPSEEGVSPQLSRSGGSKVARFAALGALALAIIAVAVIVLGGNGDDHKYRLVFETGGQLVKDNEVLIGGTPVGSINSVELTDNGQAEVDITIDQQLHEGTSAVIRSTSLSGVANRYVSITPGPNNAPALGEDAIITQVDTTAPVDLDQLFNTFDKAPPPPTPAAAPRPTRPTSTSPRHSPRPTG